MSHQLFICTHDADSELALEALDAVLMAAMLEQTVSLLFLGEGLKQLAANSNRELSDKLKSLAGFGVEHFYASGAAPFEPVPESLPLQWLNESEVPALLDRQQRIYSF